MNETVDPFRDWDAAYVLGALSTDDRHAFERHLAGCSTCSAAVMELAGIPGVLGKIEADTALALASAPTDEHSPAPAYQSIQQLAKAARQEQRRTRYAMTAGITVAAAVLIVIGILTGRAIHPAANLATSSSQGTVVAMSQVQSNAMTADLRVTSKPWGTRFDWSCSYGSTWASGYPSPAYDLVVIDASGAQTTIATWRATGPSAVALAASSGIPISNIRAVEIRAVGTAIPILRGQL